MHRRRAVAEDGSARRPRVPTWLKVGAAAVAVALVAAVAVAAIQYNKLQDNLATAPLNLSTEQADPDHKSEPVTDTDPMQVLILGTDTRSHGNDAYGSTALSSGYGKSDVMLLLQLSADRKHATVVSFPRDLMVPLPACTDPKTGVVHGPMALGQLNTALSYGGPGCTVAAINQVTGLTIDHFMMADFAAVKELSTSLGGVEVCVNQPVDDPSSGLHLPAGVSTVEGEQALAFLRTRKGFGDGSDLGRIRAQQSFLASMVRKVKSEGTLSNLPRLYSIAETVSRNLTVDDGLSRTSDLISVAKRLKDVRLDEVTFTTAPTAADPLDPNRLLLQQPRADRLFGALAADRDAAGGHSATPSRPNGPAGQEPQHTQAQQHRQTSRPGSEPEVSDVPGLPGQTADQVTCQSAFGY